MVFLEPISEGNRSVRHIFFVVFDNACQRMYSGRYLDLSSVIFCNVRNNLELLVNPVRRTPRTSYLANPQLRKKSKNFLDFSA